MLLYLRLCALFDGSPLLDVMAAHAPTSTRHEIVPTKSASGGAVGNAAHKPDFGKKI